MRLYSTTSFRSAAMHLLSTFMLVCFLLGLSTVAHAVELKLNGTKTLLSGSECGLASYRLGTQNSYAGKNLDLILEITEEDNDYVGPCVQLTGNQVSFYLRDEDVADNVAYMDLKFTVVEKGTMTPVEVDRILVTNFDLDRSNSLSLSATDDVYYKDADGAYISSNSLVQYSEGSFYGGKYNAKMRGRDTGNCSDGTTTTDVTCRAAAIWINGPGGANKVSTIYARAQNDNAYGTYNHPQALRLIQFSFELVHFQGLVTVGSDYGDAPNSYGSAGHKSDVNIGLGYGEIADSEAAHQGSTNADGDDTDATGFDDDNAVTLGGADLQGQSLPAETTQNLVVTTFGTGYLNGWVDWNRDGDFNDANEHVLDDQHITTTSVANNTIPVAIPAAVTAGNSFMRFRFSTASGVGASGYSASPGEVEDYQVVLDIPEDYGDAPSSYGEAAHSISSSNSTWLGAVASPDEGTGSSSSDASGDDSDGIDDEDAFTSSLPELIVNQSSYSLDVPCVGSGVVAGWIDFNRNTTFQSNERASANCSGGNANLSWSSISGQSVGVTYARFRIASDASDVSNPTGQALDGEVEDYPFTISNLKPTAFVCDGKPYTVIGSPSTLQEMNKSTLAVTSLGNFNPAINFNGIGYNTLDNFIYGYSNGNMYRVGYNREIQDLGVPTGSGSFDPKTHTGTMDTSGKFYGLSSSKIFIVDIGNNPDAGTLTFSTVNRSGSTAVLADIAFSTVDGKLYGMSGSKLYSIDPVTGNGQQVTVTGDNLSGAAGGAWSTADGSVYLYNNSNGKLFKVDTSQSPVTASNLGSVANNGSFDATACIPPSLQKKTSSAEVTIDEVFDYTFIINNPNATAINVSMTDILPAHLSFESGSLSSASPGGGTVITFNDNQLSINSITIPGSGKLEFSVSVRVAIDAPEGNIDNQANLYYGSNTYLSDDPDTGEIEDPTTVTVKYVYDYGDAPDDASDFKYGQAKHRVSANPVLFLGNKKAKKDQEAEVANWYNEWNNGNHKGWFKNNKDRRSQGNGNKKKDEVDEPLPQVVGDGDEEDGLSTAEYNWQNGSSCTGLLPDGTQGTISISEDRFCLTVKASNQSTIAAQLVGWIDFNQNGEFDDPLERSVTNVDGDPSNDDTQGNVPAGTNDQDVVLYWEGLSKISGKLNTFIRTRITSDPSFKSDHSPDPIGVAINGEVEDTNIGINVEGTDFGDAPDSYDDASHIIELDAYMGTIIDNDNSSQNAANGSTDGVGDDNDGFNDDDGVTNFPVLATNSTSYSIDVTATTPNGKNANLVGWIDFDGSGTFDNDEAATVVVPKNSTDVVATLIWSAIPSDIKSGNSYVRLRLTTDTSIATGTANTSLPTGLATDGEVEDYMLEIQGTLDVTKITSTPTIVAGEFAVYTITLMNNTNSVLTNVSATDTPEDSGFFYQSSSINLLNTNTANGVPTRTSILNPTALSNPMTWGSFTIPPGDAVEITVTMNAFSGTGTYNNSVTATTSNATTIINNYIGASSTAEDVTIGNVLCTTTTEAKVFYGSANGDIYSINLATGDQRLVTDKALQGFSNRGLNALATNPDVNGIAYYGNGTSVYYWDPTEGAGSSAHHLMKNLSGFDEFAGGFLESGGGAYHEGVYYIGAENLSGSGVIVDIFALTLSADGKAVLSAKPLGVQAASGNTLGGFGDFVVTSEGMLGTIYGASDVAGYWSFDIATKTYQQISSYPGQMSTDQNGQLWRGAGTLNMLNKLTGVVSGSPTYTPLATIFDLTGPYNCPQFDTDVYDYGDAPASYEDASHLILNVPKVYLGTILPDDETETLLGGDAGIGADGDDAANTNDEDGVTTFPELTDISSSYELDVIVNNTSGNVANLVGWIDFDGDGQFQNDEAATVAVNSGVSSGTVKLKWNSIPTDITANNESYLRLRFTSDTNIATGDVTTSLPSTLAADGEVEDYPMVIKVGGFPVKGRVYIDANVDGVNDTSEKGISDVPVVLIKIESNPVNNTCVSTRTDADGSYEFFPVIPGDYQLYEASLQKVPVPDNCGVVNVKDPQDYRSTTPSVLNQFSVVDAEITGKDFGDVKMPVFAPDHVDSVMPGNTVHYAHKFTAKSSGDVTFSHNNSAQADWSSTLFADGNCNGSLDSAESQLTLASAISVTEGAEICLINKVYAPANAVVGDRYSNEIIADFDYGSATAGTVSLKVTDLTTALASNDSGAYSKLELRKTVQVYRGSPLSAVSAETETQSAAKPGDVLQYRIYYSNSGTADLTDLMINDVVPEFTVLYGSPSCETPLPASLNTCTPSVSGDDIEWLFPANDVLQGGQSGMVSYQVQVE